MATPQTHSGLEGYFSLFKSSLNLPPLEELQQDVDVWLSYYNEERPHSGKYCFGKTPVQTFKDAKKIAVEKSNQLMYNNNQSDIQINL